MASPKELNDAPRNLPSTRPLPVALRVLHPGMVSCYVAQDVVHPDYLDESDRQQRHASALLWLRDSLPLYEPLCVLQYYEAKRIAMNLQRGDVAEAERCIVRLIDYQELELDEYVPRK